MGMSLFIIASAARNTGCSNNFNGGCTYWGQTCSAGQQGPPAPGDYCNFIDPSDLFCQPFHQDPVACAPSLKEQLLRSLPTRARTIRLVRTTTGGVVLFEHSV